MGGRPALNPSDYGIAMSLRSLKQLLGDLFDAYPGSSTIDELLVHPLEGIEFCRLVRKSTGYYMLPDHVILKVLVNRRKNNYRPSRPRMTNEEVRKFLNG